MIILLSRKILTFVIMLVTIISCSNDTHHNDGNIADTLKRCSQDSDNFRNFKPSTDNLIEDIIRHSLEKCTSIRGKELEDTVAKLLKNIDMAGLTFNSDDFINTHTNHELKTKYLDDSVAIYSSED